MNALSGPGYPGGIVKSEHQLIVAFVPREVESAHVVSGNPCLLHVLDSAPLHPVDAFGPTVCQSWPERQSGRPVISVRCFGPGGESIQCCGHGLLASAYAWQRQLGCEELTLSMHGSIVVSWRDKELTWLRFNAPSIKACPLPAWVREVFVGAAADAPIAAATSGSEQGYLVLQWPDHFDLSVLQPPAKSLSELTDRALICTSAQPAGGEGAIQLRYFAPQYGVVEDDATGSAVRVLGEYWSSRYTQLTARQCSLAGGLLFSRRENNHVDVGGYCVSAK